MAGVRRWLLEMIPRMGALALASLLALGPVETARAGDPTPARLEELEPLVAPLDTYPDMLTAEILVAATHPEQIAEADRWLAERPLLSERELSQELETQRWDPSVKALTRYPSVLGDLDENLSWTTSLGEAYARHPDDVLAAIHERRRKSVQ
jgi:hypothetical protein